MLTQHQGGGLGYLVRVQNPPSGKGHRDPGVSEMNLQEREEGRVPSDGD